MPADVCRICGRADGHKAYRVREMMFGSRELFDYFECAGCGCLQIAQIPSDLGRHYPKNYYSFKKPSRLRRFLKGAWLSQPLRGKNLLKRLAAFIPFHRSLPDWIGRAGVPFTASVLDIGCGFGEKLMEMHAMGFRNLQGVDPFFEGDVTYDNGISIRKAEPSALPGPYDVVMLHHSLEHIPDQRKALGEVRRLLSPSGTAIVRIPVASSFAWRHYSVDWVQLDAPRHLYLHTRASLERLAQDCGLSVAQAFHDSTDFQFWGSEQYLKDVPLFSEKSYAVDRGASMFSAAQIREFGRRAEELNRSGEGDSMVFYLKKA